MFIVKQMIFFRLLYRIFVSYFLAILELFIFYREAFFLNIKTAITGNLWQLIKELFQF